MSAQMPVTWRKSSYSGSGENCVEIGRAAAAYAIRDSKLGDGGPVLQLSARAFAAFTATLR